MHRKDLTKTGKFKMSHPHSLTPSARKNPLSIALMSIAALSTAMPISTVIGVKEVHAATQAESPEGPDSSWISTLDAHETLADRQCAGFARAFDKDPFHVAIDAVTPQGRNVRVYYIPNRTTILASLLRREFSDQFEKFSAAETTAFDEEIAQESALIKKQREKEIERKMREQGLKGIALYAGTTIARGIFDDPSRGINPDKGGGAPSKKILNRAENYLETPASYFGKKYLSGKYAKLAYVGILFGAPVSKATGDNSGWHGKLNALKLSFEIRHVWTFGPSKDAKMNETLTQEERKALEDLAIKELATGLVIQRRMLETAEAPGSKLKCKFAAALATTQRAELQLRKFTSKRPLRTDLEIKQYLSPNLFREPSNLDSSEKELLDNTREGATRSTSLMITRGEAQTSEALQQFSLYYTEN